MELCSFLSVAAPAFATSSVPATVGGDSSIVRRSAYLPSTQACAASSVLVVSLCRAFCVSSHLRPPPAPSFIAFRSSLALSPVLSIHSAIRISPAFPLQRFSSLIESMPRERQRLISRHDGARGRAAAHPSSAEESAYPATRSSRRRGRGRGGEARGREAECLQHAHPTVRYRIPCTLANSTFIVSVTIERCEQRLAPAAALQGDTEAQRGARQKATPNQAIGSMLTTTSEENIGPSTKGEPSSSALHSSDSMDSSEFGCRVVEEQPSTSAEDCDWIPPKSTVHLCLHDPMAVVSSGLPLPWFAIDGKSFGGKTSSKPAPVRLFPRHLDVVGVHYLVAPGVSPLPSIDQQKSYRGRWALTLVYMGRGDCLLPQLGLSSK